MKEQNERRLLALRAHTEAVTRGEILTGQLLEPEVIHFTVRFRPLFVKLFTAYHDWPMAVKPQPRRTRKSSVVGLEGALMTPSCGTASKRGSFRKTSYVEDAEPDAPGHMSFGAFFRFCVDFGLFPKHTNFEEIRSIYNDAEGAQRVPKITVDEEVDNATAPSPACAPTVAFAPTVSTRASIGQRKSVVGEERMSTLKNNPNLQIIISRASAMAVSIAASSTPTVDLRFFDKPLSLMSPFEITTVAFFGSADEWLSERFVRLADVVTKCDMDEAKRSLMLSEIEHVATEEAKRAAIALCLGQIADNPGMDKEAAMKTAHRLAAIATPEAVQIADPTIFISAAGLLRVLRSGRSSAGPTEAEVDEMFRLLLAGPDEDGQWGTTIVSAAGDASHAYAADDQEAAAGPAECPALIPVFQMDKVLRRARDVLDKARRWSCMLLRTQSERKTAEDKAGFAFFNEISVKLFERSQWSGGHVEDVFADCNELTPELLAQKAEELGVDESLMPEAHKLRAVMTEVVGRRECILDGRVVYRAIAFAMEGRNRQRQTELATRLRCLTHNDSEELRSEANTSDRVFGLAAFVECLLKVALHRLGFKGVSDIQRSSPAWWKCTWLLTLLANQFTEKLAQMRYERAVFDMAVQNEDSWDDAFSDTVGVGLPRNDPGPFSYGANSWLTQSRMDGSEDPERESGAGSSRAPSEAEDVEDRGNPRPGLRRSTTVPNMVSRSKTERQVRDRAATSFEEMARHRQSAPISGQPTLQACTSSASDGEASTVGVTTPRPDDAKKQKRLGSAGMSSSSHTDVKERRMRERQKRVDQQKRYEREERGPNQDAEVWWRKIHTGQVLDKLPKSASPIEWLAANCPDLFEA